MFFEEQNVSVKAITGSELKAWREQTGRTLADVGVMLGDVSGPTVGRWENGQEIPGPAQKLLRLLIHGEQPFAGIGPQPDPAAEERSFWKLRLNLDDWHDLETMSARAGFGSVRDYLLSLIQDHLTAERDSEGVRPKPRASTVTQPEAPNTPAPAADSPSTTTVFPQRPTAEKSVDPQPSKRRSS